MDWMTNPGFLTLYSTISLSRVTEAQFPTSHRLMHRLNAMLPSIFIHQNDFWNQQSSHKQWNTDPGTSPDRAFAEVATSDFRMLQSRQCQRDGLHGLLVSRRTGLLHTVVSANLVYQEEVQNQ